VDAAPNVAEAFIAYNDILTAAFLHEDAMSHVLSAYIAHRKRRPAAGVEIYPIFSRTLAYATQDKHIRRYMDPNSSLAAVENGASVHYKWIR